MIQKTENWLSRSSLIFNEEKIDILSKSKVVVFGLGGVGGYVVEALARIGIGHLDLIDNDVFTESNLNRQILSLRSNIGKRKTDEAKKRILDINPKCIVNTFDIFFFFVNEYMIDFKYYDYVVDAIDTLSSKICIIEKAKEVKTKIISAMGAGNRLNPLDLTVTDIYKTSTCPLARKVRQECRKRNITDLKVVYSKENPINLYKEQKVVGSVSFVPSVMGLIIASEVVKDLLA